MTLQIMQRKAQYLAGQYWGLLMTVLLSALSSTCSLQTEVRMKVIKVWTCYGWSVLRDVSFCFIQRWNINCTGCSPRDEDTVLNWRVLKQLALSESTLYKKLTAVVLGAITDFVLTFCNNECSSSLVHLHVYLQLQLFILNTVSRIK